MVSKCKADRKKKVGYPRANRYSVIGSRVDKLIIIMEEYKI
ncbi:MAG: hypothetical protein ACI4MS_08380 [Candidatus Coproplasma sp.]